MSPRVDLLVRGGRLIDPVHEVDAVVDIAVVDGRVAEIAPSIDAPHDVTVDATNQIVIPGLVDLHVHVSSRDNGQVGHRMLARAGVTTALDLLGEVADVLATAGDHGAGLTLACVDGLDPERHFRGERRPSRAMIRDVLMMMCRRGAIGTKLHVEHGFDSDVAAMVVEEANDLGVWIALHCGSPATASAVSGLREAVGYLAGKRAHIAHVNSYCRGDEAEPLSEVLEAIALLRTVPQVLSESYLAEINGNSARLVDGAPSSRVQAWLACAGFRADESGLIDAIADGWARIPVATADDVELLSGPEGVAAWRAAGGDTGLCLPINPALPRATLAASKDRDGQFDVDALATDGGGIPRNTTLRDGLALVEVGLLTVADLVRKASVAGARGLGLADRGHLGEGAVADIVIADPRLRRVTTTIARGEVVHRDGVVLGTGTTALVTPAGTEAATSAGCAARILDVGASGFYTGVGLKA